MEGWLYKKGAIGFGGEKKRWCVLEEKGSQGVLAHGGPDARADARADLVADPPPHGHAHGGPDARADARADLVADGHAHGGPDARADGRSNGPLYLDLDHQRGLRESRHPDTNSSLRMQGGMVRDLKCNRPS